MKNLIKNFGLFFLIFLIIAVGFSVIEEGKVKNERVGIQEFVNQIEDEKIESVVIRGGEMEVVLRDGQKEIVKKEVGQTLTELLYDLGVEKEKISKINIDVKDSEGWQFWLMNILPFLLPFLLIGGFVYFMMRGVQGANSKAMMFGQSQAKESGNDPNKRVTFKDVAGVKEAKEELKEIVEFLKFPKKFLDLGAKIPKGVLLLGSPGTGKTLLARATSGEAGVPFFHISGSEFVEMFVGVGASRVRDLFKKAKKNTPCIVFIDEIDAVGRKRGAGLGGSHDEREQTLNQILVEMDGFDQNINIIVMAATNRPDVLDSALLRPGRFDRQITVDRPDLIGREAVLAVHAKSIKLATEVSLKVIAKRTPGFSGADLANVINEAALLAARHNKNFVGMEELESSIDRVIAGPERKSRIMGDVEKKTVAFHESGHTLVAALLPNTDPVHKVSIIPRGTAALGYTMQLPMEDKYLTSESEILDTLCVLLGGRAAQEVVLHEISTGAQNDLEKASHLARNYVCRFGMSKKLGPQTFGRQSGNIFLGHDLVQEKEYSDKTAIIIDEEVTGIIMGSYEKTKKLLNDNKDKLELLAKKLEEEEVLEGEQVLELLSIEKKRPRIHKEVDIAPVEQPQQNLQFINKETDKK